MLSIVERAVFAWLRRVAPRDWPDTMEGDLNEERERGARRLWTIVQLARIASRFTTDRIAAAWRRRRRERRNGRAVTIGSDIRHAARSLVRTPGFSLVAIATLAIAIGANTAIYSALSALVLNPLPFKDGNRFVFVWHRDPNMAGVMVTPPRVAVEQWRAATHVFERVEHYKTSSLVMTGHGEPREVNVSLLTPSGLSTFGVAPAIGRPLVAADHEAGAPPVVLISHTMWLNAFGADAHIAGRSITLGGIPHTIVGVMPRQFRLPMGSDEMWGPAKGPVPEHESVGEVFAKLAPGVTIAQAQQAIDALPDLQGFEGFRGLIVSPSESNGTAIKTALFVLSGAVGLLLVIACVNVANLMLSRHSGRRHEIAIRHALGASRGRLARYLMIESLLIAVAGGAIGLLVANAGLAAIAALRPSELELLEHLRLEPNALIFTALVTLATGALFGAGPALTASRANLQEILKSGGRTATGQGHRVRAVLTIAQVSLALMLLVGATLLLRSYARVTAVDPGFNPANVLSVKVALPASRYSAKEPARRQMFFDQVLASVKSLPGVRMAAVGNGVPPETGVMLGIIETDDNTNTKRDHTILTGGHVTPDYFSLLGIPILEGRAFTDDDAYGRQPVVIVGETFAKKFWPGRASALGARIKLQAKEEWATVVGVARNVKGLGLGTQTGELQLYHPRAQKRPGFGAIVVKAEGDPRPLIAGIKQAIWAQDPLLPISETLTAEQLLSRSVGHWRFNLALLAVLAGCGVVLAIVGVYGVTALFVGQRQREVGIRMALGATRAAVAALVMRQTIAMLGVALVIGIGGALWLSRYLQSLVFQTPTRDAVSFAGAAMGIVVAAVAATIVPLRRATSVDPAVVLRSE